METSTVAGKNRIGYRVNENLLSHRSRRRLLCVCGCVAISHVVRLGLVHQSTPLVGEPSRQVTRSSTIIDTLTQFGQREDPTVNTSFL